MSLTLVNPPKKCVELASEAVQQLLLGGAPGMPVIGSRELVTLALPLQAYTLGLDDVARHSLRKARKTTWRFLVLERDTAIAAVEIDVSQGQAKMGFSSIETGPFVQETVRAITFAEGLREVAENDYAVRVLSIPALYVFSLWLHRQGDDDLIFAMPPTNQELIPNHLYKPEELFRSLAPAAERQLAFDPSAQA